MAEQSSTVAAFRAIVMLGCVILIPVAAVCGTSFPAVVKAIQSGRWPTLADFRGTDASGGRGDAPRFAPTASPVNAGILPMNTAAPQLASGATSAPSFTPPSPPREASSVIAASYNDPAVADRSNAPNGRGSLALVPSGAGNLVPPDNHASSSRAESNAPSASSDPTTRDAQFKHAHDRLKQLGAIYYLLEFWGDQQQEYRFYCRMSIGGDSHVFKPFQSIDSDPLIAMANVLKEVEAWRSGGG